MVQIAKEMIQLARQEAAQDVYLIPKSTCYESFICGWVMSGASFQTYDFDLLSSVISHLVCLRHECREKGAATGSCVMIVEAIHFGVGGECDENVKLHF